MSNASRKQGDRTSDKALFASKRVGYDNTRFVRIELDTSEQTDLRDRLLRGENVPTLDLDHLLDQGYALRVAKADEGKTTLATLTQLYSAGENCGLGLSGRGRDVAKALAALAYKLEVVIAGRSWADAAEARNTDLYDDLG